MYDTTTVGTDYQCNPSVLQLRSRYIEKPINSAELLDIAHEKQTEVYEKQKERENRGYDGEENDLEIVLLKNVSLRSYMDWIKESHHGIRPSFIPRNEEIVSRRSREISDNSYRIDCINTPDAIS